MQEAADVRTGAGSLGTSPTISLLKMLRVIGVHLPREGRAQCQAAARVSASACVERARDARTARAAAATFAHRTPSAQENKAEGRREASHFSARPNDEPTVSPVPCAPIPPPTSLAACARPEPDARPTSHQLAPPARSSMISSSARRAAVLAERLHCASLPCCEPRPAASPLGRGRCAALAPPRLLEAKFKCLLDQSPPASARRPPLPARARAAPARAGGQPPRPSLSLPLPSPPLPLPFPPLAQRRASDLRVRPRPGPARARRAARSRRAGWQSAPGVEALLSSRFWVYSTIKVQPIITPCFYVRPRPETHGWFPLCPC